MDRYFHDAQWVRKHWDLDVDFDTCSEDEDADSEGDTDCEEDATFGRDSLAKEESSEKTGSCPQLVLDQKDQRVEGGDAEVEAEGLLEQKVVADEEETNLEAGNKEVGRETREPAFSDR